MRIRIIQVLLLFHSLSLKTDTQGTVFSLSHRPNNPHRSRRIVKTQRATIIPPSRIKSHVDENANKKVQWYLPFFSPAIVVSFGVWSCYACRISKVQDPARYFLSERRFVRVRLVCRGAANRGRPCGAPPDARLFWNIMRFPSGSRRLQLLLIEELQVFVYVKDEPVQKLTMRLSR